jgi:hypothetical protein
MSENISYFFCIVSFRPVNNSKELDIFGLDAEGKEEEAYGVRFLAEGL